MKSTGTVYENESDSFIVFDEKLDSEMFNIVSNMVHNPENWVWNVRDNGTAELLNIEDNIILGYN